MAYHQSICPQSELDQRIRNLQHRLCRAEVDGALIIQKTDLYYFSGTGQQGWLYIPAEGPPLLMIFKDFDRACQESELEQIVSISGSKKIPELLSEKGYALPERIGMELDVLPANHFLSYQKLFQSAEIIDISIQIREIRAIKSPYEIERIKESAERSDKMAALFPDLIEEGLTEISLAGKIEAYARELGHQGIVRMRLWGGELFYGHLLSGPPAATPSFLASPTGGTGTTPVIGQGPGMKLIEKHEPILLDYVFAYNGYLSDCTRVYSIGTLPGELQNFHQAALEIQERVKERLRPGTTAGELYSVAIDHAQRLGINDYFMGATDRRIRFIGHGVGLELDEFPFIARGHEMPLAEGMVIALEPKAIVPGKGVVGIENMHLITATGSEQLTHSSEAVQTIKVA